jgi:hypothetical protein
VVAFIFQTLFLALSAFLIGWFLGRFIKGFFCKTPSQVGYSDDTTYSLKPIINDIDDLNSTSASAPSSSSVIKTAVRKTAVRKTAVISTAGATGAVAIGEMASSDEIKKPFIVDDASSDTAEKTEAKVADAVADIKGDLSAKADTQVVDAVVEIEPATTDIKESSTAKVDIEVADAVVDIETTTAVVKEAPTAKVDTEVADLEESSEGFDKLANIISGRAEILSSEVEDTVSPSDLSVTVKSTDSNLETITNLDDGISLLYDAAKVAVVAKVGADIIEQNDIQKTVDKAVKTVVNDDSEEATKRVSNTTDTAVEEKQEEMEPIVAIAGARIVGKVSSDLLGGGNKDTSELAKDATPLIKAMNTEESTATFEEKALEEKFAEKLAEVSGDDLVVDKMTENTESFVKESTDATSEKLEEKLNMLSSSNVNDSDHTDDKSSSLLDIAKTAVVATATGVVTKVGADIIGNKKANSGDVNTTSKEAEKDEQEVPLTKDTSLDVKGTIFRRRNVRRFRSSRR